eukprot:CAMPEP_0206425224 /NCGR_PEP_ID=MMETSP0324_2-20121206/3672_1 /ASSEMBLY_ACC=CAM_ASM_000836 /TAXON_ID=2866 /ORGANISM="Crypthecodinium cohnii, Strain Seligo" /LENGTH=81 /DNA_ID=CAMNT_0053889981 /DNA_START=569 /DNA_END=811 /DNA_ORIENTATION=-
MAAVVPAAEHQVLQEHCADAAMTANAATTAVLTVMAAGGRRGQGVSSPPGRRGTSVHDFRWRKALEGTLPIAIHQVGRASS